MCIEIKENITWLESYSSLDILSSVNPSFLNVINSCVLYHVTISTHNAMDVLRSLCLSVSLATCVMTDVRTVLSIPFSFLFYSVLIGAWRREENAHEIPSYHKATF